MRIGINGFEAVVPRFGFNKQGLPNRVGSSEVCFQTLIELERIDKENEYVIFLPSKPTSDMPKESSRWKYKVISERKLWTIFGLTRGRIAKENLDIFFSPTHYGVLRCPVPQIISILDVSYKYFPEMFNRRDLAQLAMWGGYSVRNAARIITISNSSRNDIIKEYKVSPSKVRVAYLGVKFDDQDKSELKMKDLEEKYNIQNPYILFVGTLQPRKNIVRLIEAFATLEQTEEKALDLVIIGRRGWNYQEILDAPKSLDIENRVHFLESITDEELPAFYKNAQIFVLPSLYEGFGLPVLEAMRYGCPVATSNVSSLPEAGGDAAIYFDPENVEDIAQKIHKVLKDEKLRAKMIKEGHEQVKKFSWEKSAQEVIKVFEEFK